MQRPKKRLLDASRAVKPVIFLIAVVGCFFFGQASLLSLRNLRITPSSLDDTIRLSLILFSFAFSIFAGWVAFKKWFAIPFGLIAIFVNTLALIVTRREIFFLFYFFYFGLYFLLDWFDKKNQDQILMNEVEIEKSEVEKNQMELELKKLKEEVDASLSKYTTYYGLREVAEQFATTLSLDKLAELVVKEARDFIPKGGTYLLYVAEVEEISLSLIASFTTKEEEKIKEKKGDFFDLWVLKNRKHIFISDIQKDIFFDFKQVSDAAKNVRSVIIVPLVSEGRVLGTFRVSSAEPNAFTIDDLRILDFISVLASSAIANAIFYQKTEELAIRDSLTGLYVQRYFKERLKEEHRRALITNASLSLLMCDLDRFKSYNDFFGHGAGDMILLRVSQILLNEVKEDGIVARYGGEEFAILLPRFSKKEAIELAEKIRERIEKEKIEVRREPTHTTISIGISTMPEDTLEREEFIRKADENLYTAKRNGRNRVFAQVKL